MFKKLKSSFSISFAIILLLLIFEGCNNLSPDKNINSSSQEPNKLSFKTNTYISSVTDNTNYIRKAVITKFIKKRKRDSGTADNG